MTLAIYIATTVVLILCVILDIYFYRKAIDTQDKICSKLHEAKSAKTIQIKYFTDAQPIEKLELGDWIDLRSRETVELKAGEEALIPLGVAMKLPDEYEAHIAPRSSTYKKYHILQTNSVGVVDNSYSGDKDEWKMPVLAIKDTVIPAGDRICQFRIVRKQPSIVFHRVEALGDKSRGGFGSTGER